MDEVKPIQTEQAPASAKKYWLIIGFLVLTIIMLCGALIYRQKPQSSPITIQPTPTTSQATLSQDLVFMRNKELWIKDSIGSESQVTQTNSSIYSFKYSPESKTIAYFLGEENPNTGGVPFLEPRSLVLRSLDSAATTDIFDLMPARPKQSSDYTVQLRDLNFSDDGSKLAFTTSDSLWIYDLQTKTKRMVFQIQPTFSGGGGGYGVYAYYAPIFSPDMTKILLRKGYYEGSGQIVADVATGQVTDLKYSSYISGKLALGWLDNSQLIVSDYSDATDINPTSKLLSVSFPDLSESLITNITGSVYLGLPIDNKIIFTTTSNSGSDQTTHVIYQLDLQSKQTNEVYKTTPGYSVYSLIKDTSHVYANIGANNADPKSYMVERIYPQPSEVVLSNASIN